MARAGVAALDEDGERRGVISGVANVLAIWRSEALSAGSDLARLAAQRLGEQIDLAAVSCCCRSIIPIPRSAWSPAPA